MICTSERFKRAMRQFPASVTIIATGRQPLRVGMTATAVCSLSVSPPEFLVCLNVQAGTCKAVLRNGHFSVNVLQTNQQDVARRFAGLEGNATGDAKFDSRWEVGAFGTPILGRSLLAFECRLVKTYEAGTHVLAVGAIEGVAEDASQAALVYCNGTFGQWSPLATSGQRETA